MTQLLDQHGRPFEKEKVLERGGKAYSFPEKDHWQRSIATGLTPTRLAQVLRDNDRGETQDLLTLSYEMEERCLHLYGQLKSRINAVTHVPMRAEARKKDDATAKKIAEACQETVIDQPHFKWLVQDLMDAIARSYSVIQPVWDTTTRPWSFKSFEHFDPRLFQFDVSTKKELRIRQDDNPEGRPIPAGLFLVHYPRLRTGIKLRGSIARLAAVNWFFKTTSVTDWLAFAEVYGMPIRIGKYNAATATPDELATLHMALVNLGHDASAMIPDGMKLEIVDARRPTSGDNLYKGIVDYFDEQTSRAILGQVLASDARATGLGTAIADLHSDVRQDIREEDALALRATIEYLLRLWTFMNYGPAAPVPKLFIDIRPKKDLKAFTEAILPWHVQGGLPIPKTWLYDQLDVPEPLDGEEVVKAPLAPGTPGSPIAGTKSVKRPGNSD